MKLIETKENRNVMGRGFHKIEKTTMYYIEFESGAATQLADAISTLKNNSIISRKEVDGKNAIAKYKVCLAHREYLESAYNM